MRAFLIVLIVWLATGFSTVLGSVAGRLIGRTGLFAGAIAGALLGVFGAVALVSRIGWLSRSDARGAISGGIGGFGLAAAILFFGPDFNSLISPILLSSLAGLGALFGAGVTRGLRGGGARDSV